MSWHGPWEVRRTTWRLAIDAGQRPSKEALHAWRDRIDDADMELWLYAVELVCRAEGRTQNIDAMTLWRRMDATVRDDLLVQVEASRRRMLEALTV